MPETAIDEDGNFLFCEDNVRFSGQIIVDTVSSDTLGKKKFTEFHLRSGIFCPDVGHVVFPLGLSEDIGHQFLFEIQKDKTIHLDWW